MKSFLKSLMVNISILFEVLKSFIIMCVVIIAIITALSAILHNVFKIREIYAEDKSGYKKLVTVSENRMNVQVVGEGERTAVILSSFGAPSPIVQYKTYTDRLVENGYRVVVVEYFGYGYSLSSKDPRTLNYIVSEIKDALEVSEIYGPYTIIANGISALYAEGYASVYSDLVNRLILIDGIYPATINESYMQKYIDNQKFNVTLTSWAELTGYARILSYVNPSMFGIDKMKEYGFSKTDIAVYRKMIANRFYSSTMRREYKDLDSNMDILKNYTLPDYLNATQILSSGYIEEFKEYKNQNLMQKDIEEYANDLITNSYIQEIVTIEGEKERLNLDNPDSVINEIIKY